LYKKYSSKLYQSFNINLKNSIIMKKFFTIAAALFASLTMFAQTITLSEVTPESNWYSVEGVGRVANKSGSAFSSGEMSCEGITGFKTGSSYFTIQTFTEVSSIIVGAQSGSKRNIKAITVSEDLMSGAQSSSNVDFELIGGSEDYAIVSGACGNEFTINFKDPVPANSYIQIVLNGNAEVFAVTFGGAAPSTDPVSEVTVTGPTEGFVGIPVTLKAKTDKKADKIWWTDKYGTTLSEEAEFTFTPAAEGEVTYTAWAENEYNVSPALKEHTLTIAGKLCGELIKATHTGGKTATVEGVIGGTADKNTANDGKFGGKGQYFGITLASGTFLAGDELNVHTTKAAEQGTLAIYADKAGETLLYDSESFGAEGDNIIYLPAALNDLSTLYICRTADNNWNGFVDFISVTRSCGASSNADVSEVRVNGVVVEPEGEKGTLYNYTLSASYSEPTVSIALTLAHPKATIKYGLDNPYEMGTPDAGSSKGQAFTIVAEDGVTEKTITVNVAKSATLSNNWFLSELSIDGYTLDPAFTPENNEYNITKPYGAANPTESDIHAVTQHPGATIQSIDINPTSILIMVMAENGVSSNGYVIWIQEAAAKKDLLEVAFSNGVHGFITAGNIDVPFLEGEAEPTFVSATFWEPDGEPKAEMVEGKLVVTGIDGQQAEYTITYHAITPMEYSTEEVVFDAVPSYIYSVYEFDADKGVKFAKDVEEAKNHRISEGKDRIYIALPAANKVLLTSGTGAKRPVKILVNGEESAVAQTAASDEAIEIILSKEHANFVAIESNGSNGDGGFIKLQLSEESGQGIEDLDASEHAVKFFQDGQILIRRGEKIFTVTGQEK
jgi:hypothetical protein